jgi:hypothetical protein
MAEIAPSRFIGAAEMTREQAEKIIRDYEALLAHAIRTLEMPGQSRYDDYSFTARLKIEGDGSFILASADIDYGYYDDGPSIREHSVPVRADLLLLSGEALTALIDTAKAEEAEKEEQRAKREEAARLHRELAAELNLLRLLTLKYGAPPK